MRAIFMGTPAFAVPSLNKLTTLADVVAVYTQPDRRQGRGLALAPSAVKEAALKLNLPVFQPARLRDESSWQQLQELAPELIVVAAYGQILDARILALPTHGCINIHASLLPAYRGGAPIHWAIVNGESETGITTMLMDAGLDTGAILLQDTLPIDLDDTCGHIHDRLAKLGAHTLAKTLGLLKQGELKSKPQPRAGVSYARNLKKEDGLIDWTQGAAAIHNLVRGLNPWPVAYTYGGGRLLRVFQTAIPTAPGAVGGAAGEVIDILQKDLLVATGQGHLLLKEVQPAGRRRMSAADYARGYWLRKGSKLGL